MKKSFETELPEGYREAYTIDAKKGKTVVFMNLACLVITAAVIAIAWVIIRPDDLIDICDILHGVLFIVAMFLYIVLHELVHGAVYKITTGRKLTFGFTFSVAYCGVPDIYVYRKTALLALLAPFAVFLPVFLIPTIVCPIAGDRLYCAVLLAIHIGGCVGDLYDALLYVIRFRSPDTLMRDTGPKQTFYTQ